MLEVPMATSGPHLPPASTLEQFNRFPHLHRHGIIPLISTVRVSNRRFASRDYSNSAGASASRASPRSSGVLRDNHCMDAIVRDPEIMHGTPVFRDTRVPVQTLFDYIEGGETIEDFLEGFPTVPRELALKALEQAKHLLLAHA